MPLPSDTFHDKLFAYDQGDGADYDHDPRGGTVALYTTCVPLSSDTFHDKLSSCDQGDDAEYDHDHEEGLWLSMQPVCLCRRTPFMISSLHMTMVMVLIMIMTHEEGLWISMQPLCLCRRTPFILTFGVHAGVPEI